MTPGASSVIVTVGASKVSVGKEKLTTSSTTRASTVNCPLLSDCTCSLVKVAVQFPLEFVTLVPSLRVIVLPSASVTMICKLPVAEPGTAAVKLVVPLITTPSPISSESIISSVSTKSMVMVPEPLLPGLKVWSVVTALAIFPARSVADDVTVTDAVFALLSKLAVSTDHIPLPSVVVLSVCTEPVSGVMVTVMALFTSSLVPLIVVPCRRSSF